MDRKLWKRSYTSFPRFECPNCVKGTLAEKAGSFQLVEPKHISNDLASEGVEGELANGRFIGFLTCSNKWCGETVCVAGDYETRLHPQYNFEEDRDDSFEVTSYIPCSMRPAPSVIALPKGLDINAHYHLLRAYELLWVDPASCANRLRIVVEYLLDQLKIPRKGKKGAREDAQLNLAERIELLKTEKPGHEEALTALRYVGNVGSHEGVAKFEDVLDCFDFLEEAMIELLEGPAAKRKERIQKFIATKGKPGSS